MRFDPRRKVEYYPREFTPGSRNYHGHYDDGPSLPVRLTDDMIMRAHYLDLGLSQLMEKQKNGELSDQEYIQYYRMDGELRGLLRHIWEIGNKALRYWIDDHLRGGNPAFGIGFPSLKKLLEEIKNLGLSADPAVELLKDEFRFDDDDVKRFSIGAPMLNEEYDHDQYEQEEYEEALERAGVSDISEVEITDADKWWFVLDTLENFVDDFDSEIYPSIGVDYENPESFMIGPSEDEGYYDQWSSSDDDDQGYHVDLYSDLRKHPDYEGRLNEFLIDKWDEVNNMRSHIGLLDEMSIDEEEWNSLDTRTQMALISRLMQAQHRTGNILTDFIPEFEFTSGRYTPEKEDSYSISDPSPKSVAMREMLDDLNQSPMVESWDEMMKKYPKERWSSIGFGMVRTAQKFDDLGFHSLADGLERIIRAQNDALRPLPPRVDGPVECGSCGREMVLRYGRNGWFWGCSGYPECKNTIDPSGSSRPPAPIAPEGTPEITCPDCGRPMRLRNSKYGLFWGCSGYPECRATHGAHPDGRPLGRPGTKEEKEARVRAHAAFDRLWSGKGAPMRRDEAYRWMQEAMGLSDEDAHIGKFDVGQSETLIGYVNEFMSQFRPTSKEILSLRKVVRNKMNDLNERIGTTDDYLLAELSDRMSKSLNGIELSDIDQLDEKELQLAQGHLDILRRELSAG